MIIARLWHGVTTAENASQYEELLRSEILPGIHRVEGYRGAYLLAFDRRRSLRERRSREFKPGP